MMRIIVAENSVAAREQIFMELKLVAQNQAHAYLVVPEQFTMQTDIHLLDALNAEVLMDIKVKSFGSLSREVLSRVGGQKLSYVNEGGRRMLIQYLLDAHQQEFSIYKNIGTRFGIAEKLEETIRDYRSLAIHAEYLQELSGRENISPLLAKKLQETAILMSAYEEYLGEAILDSESRLALLSEQIQKASWLANVMFYFDGFHSMGQRELDVLKALEQIGAQVTMTLILPQDAINGKGDWWRFNAAFQTSWRFLEVLRQQQFAISLDFVENTDKVLSHTRQLAKEIYALQMQPVAGQRHDLEIWKGISPQQEVLYLCGWIRRKVIEENCRWRDFHITTNQPDVYFPLMRRIFEQYHVPVFMDERKPLAHHYFVRYLLNVLDMVVHQFSYPSVFSSLQTGLSSLNDEEIVALDYFARVKHLRGTMYFDERYFEAPSDNVRSKKAEGLRARQPLAAQAQKKFVALFKPFYEDMKVAKTGKEFATVLYHFMSDPQLLDAFHANEQEKTAEQLEMDEQILQTIVALLEQLVDILGDMSLTLEQFARIFEEGLGETSLGILPPAQDQVMAVQLSRARTGRAKWQIVVGMSDAWLPSQAADHTVFMREEKQWLEKAGLSLPSNETRILEDEALCLYECLTKPTEGLVLSYPLSKGNGENMNESGLITQTKRLFPDVAETSLLARMKEVRPYLEWESLKAAAEWVRQYGDKTSDTLELSAYDQEMVGYYAYFKKNNPGISQALNKGLSYVNTHANIGRDLSALLYRNLSSDTVSISELENWQNCPYKHFVHYGLRPEESVDYRLGSDELGNVLHGVLDRLTGGLRQHPDWIYLEDDALLEQIDEYLEEESQYYIDTQRREEAQNAAVLTKLRRNSYRAGRYIVRQLRHSGFQPQYHEAKFGQDKALFPPIYLELDGQVLRLEGRIDRIDSWNNGKDTYFRVVDYKSGSKKFDISRAYNGLDLQLLLYLRAALGWEKAPLPAGVFYLSMKKPFVETTSQDPEEIEKLMAEQLLMDGVFIDDPQVIAALDAGVQEGNNSVIRLAGGKQQKNALSAEQMERLLNHMVEVAQQTAQAVVNGDIAVRPTRLDNEITSCSYCNYKSVCQYEPGQSGNRERAQMAKVDWKNLDEFLQEGVESNGDAIHTEPKTCD